METSLPPSTSLPRAPGWRAICGGLLRFAHFGTALGNAHPRDARAVERIGQALSTLGESTGVLMQPEFTHRLCGADAIEPWRAGLWRSTFECDGLHLGPGDRPVMIANGDCCVGVLSNGERAVVMHLGLDCLHRADGPTVLEQAVEALSGQGALRFFAGGAIGPCCHGYSHGTEAERRRAALLASMFGADVVGGEVLHGPRKGAIAYDHREMAVRLARSLGVEHVEQDLRCTSCAGMVDPDAAGYGAYFSHTRDRQGGRERNLAVVGWAPPLASAVVS